MNKEIIKDFRALFEDIAKTGAFEDDYELYKPKTIPQICASIKKSNNDILISLYGLNEEVTITFLRMAHRVSCLFTMLYISYNEDELKNTYNETLHELLYIMPDLMDIARTLELYETLIVIDGVQSTLKQFQ